MNAFIKIGYMANQVPAPQPKTSSAPPREVHVLLSTWYRFKLLSFDIQPLSCSHGALRVATLLCWNGENSTAGTQDQGDLLVLALAQSQLRQNGQLALACVPSMLPHLMCYSPPQTAASWRWNSELLQADKNEGHSKR